MASAGARLRQAVPNLHRMATPAAAANWRQQGLVVAVPPLVAAPPLASAPAGLHRDHQHHLPRADGNIFRTPGPVPAPREKRYNFVAAGHQVAGNPPQVQMPHLQQQQQQQQQRQQQQHHQQQQRLQCGYPPTQGMGYAHGLPFPQHDGPGFLQGMPQAAMYGDGMWQHQGAGARKPLGLPSMPLPQQLPGVENACWQVSMNTPDLPHDRVSGVFAVAQTGEILTICAPREGEEWMNLNPRHDEQRWSVLNSMMAVLAASRVQNDRTMLEQFEALVQPTQYLEFLRKTMPMSEAHLDMMTTMHETMMRRLKALEVLYKGGQKAVDEFTSSSLTGKEKLKAAAVAKAKKSSEGGGGGGNNRKRQRRGNGGGGGAGGGGSTNQTSGAGGSFGGGNAPRDGNGGGNGPTCAKCKRYGHKIEDCRSA
jgi:hypothetical protein